MLGESFKLKGAGGRGALALDSPAAFGHDLCGLLCILRANSFEDNLAGDLYSVVNFGRPLLRRSGLRALSHISGLWPLSKPLQSSSRAGQVSAFKGLRK